LLSPDGFFFLQERNPPTQLTAMVAQSNLAYKEQQWLANSWANTHITNQLKDLQIKQLFQQIEEVVVGNVM
jgi:hypothetical protein